MKASVIAIDSGLAIALCFFYGFVSHAQTKPENRLWLKYTSKTHANWVRQFAPHASNSKPGFSLVVPPTPFKSSNDVILYISSLTASVQSNGIQIEIENLNRNESHQEIIDVARFCKDKNIPVFTRMDFREPWLKYEKNTSNKYTASKTVGSSASIAGHPDLILGNFSLKSPGPADVKIKFESGKYYALIRESKSSWSRSILLMPTPVSDVVKIFGASYKSYVLAGLSSDSIPFAIFKIARGGVVNEKQFKSDFVVYYFGMGEEAYAAR